MNLRKDVGGVAEERDGDGPVGPLRPLQHRQRLVERGRLGVDIAGAQAELDAALLAFDGEAGGAGHRRRERLRAAHAAEPGGEDPAAGKVAAIVLPAELHESLVGALHDALAADIDPRAGRHLAVHGEAFPVERVEMLPGCPVRHEVGIGEEHARRVGVGLEHADRLAGLDQERLVGLELSERPDDPVKALPVAGGAPDAAIDDEFLRSLGDLGVEIVHQHAKRRLGEPALRREVAAARRADRPGIVASCHRGSPSRRRRVSGLLRRGDPCRCRSDRDARSSGDAAGDVPGYGAGNGAGDGAAFRRRADAGGLAAGRTDRCRGRADRGCPARRSSGAGRRAPRGGRAWHAQRPQPRLPAGDGRARRAARAGCG